MTCGQWFLYICIGASGVCTCVGVCVAEVWMYVGMTLGQWLLCVCISAPGVCVCVGVCVAEVWGMLA